MKFSICLNNNALCRNFVAVRGYGWALISYKVRHCMALREQFCPFTLLLPVDEQTCGAAEIVRAYEE
jgi:hypothetical protein